MEKALRFLTRGYEMNQHQIVNGALFDVEYEEMVVVRDIEYFSHTICYPSSGRMHVAYLPRYKVIGMSKIPPIVDMFARRLQIQERSTHEVAQAIRDVIDPEGVGVISDASLCMLMRDVEKQHSGTITSAMLGALRDWRETRREFLSLVDHAGSKY